MPPRLLLMRHGETAWSLTGQHTGHTDLPLTAAGEARARNLSVLLRNAHFSEVLSSPLQRARRTCELAGFGAVARIEPRLREWDYGDYEGRTTADIRTQRPDWNIYRDGCPAGESAAQVSDRADQLLGDLRRMDGMVALFSHGQFLRALAVRWIELPIQNGQHLALDTASVSLLGYEYTDMVTPAITLWNVAPNALFDVVPHMV